MGQRAAWLATACGAPSTPPSDGRGTGTALVAFAEERIFRDHRNVFLCVSDFNLGARRLYERHGYRETARRPMIKNGWQSDATAFVLLRRPA